MSKRIISPCAKCPYKLRKVTTPVNPCPACKLSGYEAYEQMKKLTKQDKRKDKDRILNVIANKSMLP